MLNMLTRSKQHLSLVIIANILWTCSTNQVRADDFSQISPTLSQMQTVLARRTPPESELLRTFSELKQHLVGTLTLNDERIAICKKTINDDKELFGNSEKVITTAFDLVETYDTVMGPLWVKGSQMAGEFNRSKVTDDIHWTIYHVMQYIMDYIYTDSHLATYETLLGGFKFGCARDFPGHVDPPINPNVTHTATINASFPRTFGHDTMHWVDRPARKPTGTYLAPGTRATITVPKALVKTGYQIRVGAHSWDLAKKSRVLRLERASLVYDIDRTEVKVANPLGGGIYIEVPYLADAGIVEIQIKNAVRAPYFSAKPFHRTTLDEWRKTERQHPAPWADFQSEKFMMQVPTSWIYKMKDPAQLMADWDKALDVTNDLMGFPHDRGKETLYDQVDVIIRANAYSPGYPQVNNTYNPNKDYGGSHSNYLVRGPQYAPSFEFHELGHAYHCVKFAGETESTVNLLHVPVWHREFGYDLDTAFRASRGYQNKYMTLDTTAVCWMMCENFKKNQPMEKIEKQYQLKGHAKFVDMARLFGWEAVYAFWYSINVDYENGINWSRHNANIDDLILRWCQCAGVDLRPLFHFWGIHPKKPAALQSAIQAENLPSSTKIYDLLVRYKSLIPPNKTAYREFASNWWKKQPSAKGYTTERYHAHLWETYDETYAAGVRTNLENIITLYFPDAVPVRPRQR